MNRAREKAIRAGLALIERSKQNRTLSQPTPDAHKGAIALDQHRLDVATRSKMSRLPWRGQFPPEFVGYLIDTICPESRSFLDPFCGSGTVLFEAVARGRLA